MATIKDVEVFATGTHNGRSFSGDDLDTIVRAFDEGGLAGKLPVKLGHSHDDKLPSQGWLTSMRRVGDKIVADIGDVAPGLIDEIKQGRWRHVSIELLHEATINGRTYSWAPDGLAILGAVRPAVQSLEGLHRLVASAMPGITFRERLAFSYSGGDELAELRATVAKQHQQLLQQAIERDIEAGACLPAARHGFSLVYRLDDTPESYSRVTLGDWQQFRATQPRGMTARDQRPASMARLDADQLLRVADPGARVVELHEAVCREFKLDPANALDYDKAQRIVFKRHPQLAHDYLNMAGRV